MFLSLIATIPCTQDETVGVFSQCVDPITLTGQVEVFVEWRQRSAQTDHQALRLLHHGCLTIAPGLLMLTTRMLLLAEMATRVLPPQRDQLGLERQRTQRVQLMHVSAEREQRRQC